MRVRVFKPILFVSKGKVISTRTFLKKEGSKVRERSPVRRADEEQNSRRERWSAERHVK